MINAGVAGTQYRDQAIFDMQISIMLYRTHDNSKCMSDTEPQN